MKHSDPRRLVQLERQLQLARRLRAETLAGGFARAIEELSVVLRRMADALGAQGLSVANWRG